MLLHFSDVKVVPWPHFSYAHIVGNIQKMPMQQHPFFYSFLLIFQHFRLCLCLSRLSYFNEVDGVIFIASLSGYNLILEEDPTENQMIECIKLFYTLTNSAFFAKTPFILFLNKTDVFK